MSTGSIKILSLSNYVKPVIEESYSEDWVLNGKQNSYFRYVIDRYNGSSTNSAIINSFVERILGKGLTAFEASEEELTRLEEIIPKKELKKFIADFKTQGNAVLQVIRAAQSDDVVKAYHIPIETMAPQKCNKEGDIENYYYSQNWKDTHTYRPEKMPAFKIDGKEKKSILWVKKYRPGQFYFAVPDYQAALQYAELEEEIANFSINHIKNGLSLGQIINFNNGKPSPEVQEEIEAAINRDIKGSGGKRFIISFNDSKETQTEIQQISKDDASAEWHFWVNEARQQIITGHRVVSPMLFGIKDSTGLGNNANEMDVANSLMEETVIRPDQEVILDAIDEILAANGIQLDLAFKPLKEMAEETGEVKEADTVEVKEEEAKEVGLKVEKKNLTGTAADELIACGEDPQKEGFEVIHEIEVDYKEEDRLSLSVSTGTARANAKSEQDTNDFIIRYRYVGDPNPEREFCRKMMQANKVYRKEDIIQMGSKVVNEGLGPRGADTYSIWEWKGGVYCHHKWNRVIYLKKGKNVDANSPLAEIISTSEARRRGYKIPANENVVSIAPINTPTRGEYRG